MQKIFDVLEEFGGVIETDDPRCYWSLDLEVEEIEGDMLRWNTRRRNIFLYMPELLTLMKQKRSINMICRIIYIKERIIARGTIRRRIYILLQDIHLQWSFSQEEYQECL